MLPLVGGKKKKSWIAIIAFRQVQNKCREVIPLTDCGWHKCYIFLMHSTNPSRTTIKCRSSIRVKVYAYVTCKIYQLCHLQFRWWRSQSIHAINSIQCHVVIHAFIYELHLVKAGFWSLPLTPFGDVVTVILVVHSYVSFLKILNTLEPWMTLIGALTTKRRPGFMCPAKLTSRFKPGF